jgi:uncharacterized SAM-binding protein YcdF (DUF218 family)
MPYRAEEAARLFQMGKAPEVWVSRPENPAADLQKFGIRFVGEEEYDCEILIHEGGSEAVVHILPDPIVNTEQEVEEVAPEMRRAGKTKVIIVTSPQHTRRVKALWKKPCSRCLAPWLVARQPTESFRVTAGSLIDYFNKHQRQRQPSFQPIF